MNMLKINNLFVTINGKEIVKGLTLTIKLGEIHTLMGPNGSGKSSLAMAVVGHPHYVIARSQSESEDDVAISLDGVSLIDKTPDERARMGLFLAMQHPVGVEGVTVEQLLRRSVQEIKNQPQKESSFASWPPSTPPKSNPSGFGRTSVPLSGTGPSEKLKIDVLKFRKDLDKLAEKVGVSKELLKRSINVGFSGGEKKRLEVLQMLVLKPKYAILDETDSGLDVDALRTIAKTVKSFANQQSGILVITHYTRLLQYLKPDYVHIMKEGKIVKSGGKEVAERIEKEGYGNNKEK